MLETITASDEINPLRSIEGGDAVMPSLNHSYICLQIIRQLISNDEIEPLPE